MPEITRALIVGPNIITYEKNELTGIFTIYIETKAMEYDMRYVSIKNDVS
jgi:hypothetical protein